MQKKIQAEPGKARQRESDVALKDGDIRPGDLKRDDTGDLIDAPTPHRWVGSGRTVYNNKGKPVLKYEPFFSSTHLYEPERDMTDTGVSPVLFYDPLERVIATLHPNHTYEKVVFDPWRQITYDVSDTVTATEKNQKIGDPRTDPDIARFVEKYFNTQPATWQTWYEARDGLLAGNPEHEAAQKAALHADTPTVAHLDTLGRAFLTVAHNKYVREGVTKDEKYATRIELDIEGNQRAVIDAKDRAVMRYDYDIAGPEQDEDSSANLHQSSMEAGERWVLKDVTGKPIRAWDSRGFVRRLTYDELRRPTGLYVTENGQERLAERTRYGEAEGDAFNHCTRVHKVYDGAGIVINVRYDFRGNPLETRRDLLPIVIAAKQAVNWSQLQDGNANDESYTSETDYDALNRPIRLTNPHTPTMTPSVTHLGYNEANLLEKVEVNLRGSAASTPFVTNIDYNAKGQRERIDYKNGVTTTYQYDEQTFRLAHLKTTRPAGLNGLCSEIFNGPTVVQDLHYAYDPVGNITRIEDAALKTVHNGLPINPVCGYTYDAINRLIEATGREHIGQNAFDFNPPNGNRRDYPFVGSAAPNDLHALRNYTERYEYDAVGNFERISHSFQNGGWNRHYDYKADSLIEPGVHFSNRLTKTRLGNGINHTETYTYTDAQGQDVHGCMTAINQMEMAWDFEDQLQRVDLGGGGTAYYIYDAGGQRVRKVIESQNGFSWKERVYLGGFEIYREHNGNGVTLERESLHVMDDQQRIALVETKTTENGAEVPNPLPVQCYQLGNHLGSASVELNQDGVLISYEEYHPYGTTAFQVGRSAAEVSLRRYRYTGKERDEETGLYYHGARYYCPWLARWTAADPAGMGDGINAFSYVKGNPIRYMDPEGSSTFDAVINALTAGGYQSYRLAKQVQAVAEAGSPGGLGRAVGGYAAETVMLERLSATSSRNALAGTLNFFLGVGNWANAISPSPIYVQYHLSATESGFRPNTSLGLKAERSWQQQQIRAHVVSMTPLSAFAGLAISCSALARNAVAAYDISNSREERLRAAAEASQTAGTLVAATVASRTILSATYRLTKMDTTPTNAPQSRVNRLEKVNIRNPEISELKKQVKELQRKLAEQEETIKVIEDAVLEGLSPSQGPMKRGQVIALGRISRKSSVREIAEQVDQIKAQLQQTRSRLENRKLWARVEQQRRTARRRGLIP